MGVENAVQRKTAELIQGRLPSIKIKVDPVQRCLVMLSCTSVLMFFI
jgi:hypothetical protein